MVDFLSALVYSGSGGDYMWIKLRDDIHPMDLFGIFHIATISKDKIYKVVDSDEQHYKLLDDEGKYVKLHKSYFTENVSIDLCNSNHVYDYNSIQKTIFCKIVKLQEHIIEMEGIYKTMWKNDECDMTTFAYMDGEIEATKKFVEFLKDLIKE